MANIVYKMKPEYFTKLYDSYAEGFEFEQNPFWLEDGRYWCFDEDWCDYEWLETLADSKGMTTDEAKNRFFYELDLDDFPYGSEFHGKGSLDEFLSAIG